MYYIPNENFIAHYGVKGMKWKKRKAGYNPKLSDLEGEYENGIYDKGFDAEVERKAMRRALEAGPNPIEMKKNYDSYKKMTKQKALRQQFKHLTRSQEASAAQNRRAKQNKKDKERSKKKKQQTTKTVRVK